MGLAIGFLLPFIGTACGAACVFFIQDHLQDTLQKTLLGFAAGVMIAASVWSLLIPAMDLSAGMEKFAFVPAAVGFIGGILFLLLLDHLIPHLHMQSLSPEGMPCKLSRSAMLLLAVTLHNIPEGMAVGVIFAGIAGTDGMVTFSTALALSIGIAIQNFPEGAIISLPLVSENGISRKKSFLFGTLSGIVEPIAAIITFLLSAQLLPFLPYLLAFAAGAMVYVVVEELIPESAVGFHSNLGTLGFAAGFVLMMILDVALG